ncbi:MAG: ATP-binding cassette domain-containing protein [Finegoldia sp.]|nr:ATP-binding cassette domain-containing protein [Finegoldia sp.]
MLKVDLRKNLESFVLDVNFDLEDELVCLMGRSGSGKTSILNLIAGILTPDEGSVVIDEKILFDSDKRINLEIQKRQVGYVFQDYALFANMTVRRNIDFQLKDPDLVESLISLMGIGDLLKRYPKNLSGGEKQKVAIVRALSTRPKILLMDEPFSAIDQDFKDDFYKDLLEVRKITKIPTILVTHNKKEAEILADRILKIDSGKLINP